MSKKAKKATRSTALARRPQPRRRAPARSQALMRVKVNDPNNLLLIPEQPHAIGALTATPSVGNLGLVEVKLKPEEELVLNEPVDANQVLIKPTGQPYLPHKVYTQWFNRAFGRLGWMIVPASQPTKAALDKEDARRQRHLVLVPYLLHVHGHPVAFAWGEQEYSEHNAEQTYGDAVEATVANALRRVAKRLGVGLELWDKDWLNAWRSKHAIQVKVKQKYPTEKVVMKWRRPSDPPLPYELGKRTASDVDDADYEEMPPPPGDESRRTPRPAAGNDGNGDAKITKPQRQRLATIARKAGRNDNDVRLWLIGKWKVKTSADILRKDYDAICRELEARGPLAIPGDGEGR